MHSIPYRVPCIATLYGYILFIIVIGSLVHFMGLNSARIEPGISASCQEPILLSSSAFPGKYTHFPTNELHEYIATEKYFD